MGIAKIIKIITSVKRLTLFGSNCLPSTSLNALCSSTHLIVLTGRRWILSFLFNEEAEA